MVEALSPYMPEVSLDDCSDDGRNFIDKTFAFKDKVSPHLGLMAS